MAAASGIRAGAAYVELFVKDSRLVKGLNAASARLKAFGASITALGATLAGLGVTLALPFLGAAKLFADMGSDMKDMSDRTGVAVEALSELRYAAEQSGSGGHGVAGHSRRHRRRRPGRGDGGCLAHYPGGVGILKQGPM